jgi:hypothetical protein
MTECTERSEGREGMPGQFSMTECTERSEGMPIRFGMNECHHGGKAI